MKNLNSRPLNHKHRLTVPSRMYLSSAHREYIYLYIYDQAELRVKSTTLLNVSLTDNTHKN